MRRRPENELELRGRGHVSMKMRRGKRTDELLLELIFKGQTKAMHVGGPALSLSCRGSAWVTGDLAVRTVITKKAEFALEKRPCKELGSAVHRNYVRGGEQHIPKHSDRAVPSTTSVTIKAQSACRSLGNKKPCHDGQYEVNAYSTPSSGGFVRLLCFHPNNPMR